MGQTTSKKSTKSVLERAVSRERLFLSARRGGEGRAAHTQLLQLHHQHGDAQHTRHTQNLEQLQRRGRCHRERVQCCLQQHGQEGEQIEQPRQLERVLQSLLCQLWNRGDRARLV